jgi:hypothetical protein
LIVNSKAQHKWWAIGGAHEVKHEYECLQMRNSTLSLTGVCAANSKCVSVWCLCNGCNVFAEVSHLPASDQSAECSHCAEGACIAPLVLFTLYTVCVRGGGGTGKCVSARYVLFGTSSDDLFVACHPSADGSQSDGSFRGSLLLRNQSACVPYTHISDP